MLQKNIITPKTARYFVSGDLKNEIKTIYFVCHGYGQLAGYFIRNFEILEADDTLIVAPEGLHRFYWEKFSGRVVASWMTKEDRESDIKDYINYLDLVYREVMEELKNKPLRIIVLGFSQGATTVCRWLNSTKIPVDGLILWAGSIPSDIQLMQDYFATFKTYFVVGNADEFIQEKEVKEYESVLIKMNIPFEIIRYDGKHEIDETTLKRIADKQLIK